MSTVIAVPDDPGTFPTPLYEKEIQTPQELQTRVDDYFVDRDEVDRPYTMTGLALAMGTTRKGLLTFRGHPAYSAIVGVARRRVRASVEERILAGNQAAGGPIFWLKNNDNYRDKTEVNHGAQDSLASLLKDLKSTVGPPSLRELKEGEDVIEVTPDEP